MQKHVDSDFILQHIPHVQITYKPLQPNATFTIDSRMVQPGDIFVAITGNKSDGHDFIEQALQRQASGLMINHTHEKKVISQHGSILNTISLIVVADTTQALIDLAKAWRQQFQYPIVGITGTVGKTTTKEMVRNILKVAHKPAVVSFGNQNTLLGISMNILKMRHEHTAAVFEMGISQQGDMEKLVDLVQPTLSVITHVGHGHTQGLGSVQNVAHEKRMIFSKLSEKNIGIINGDIAELANISYTHPVIRFGKKTNNQIQARKINISENSMSFIAKIYNKKYSVILPTCNQARIMNALAAIAVGYVLEIPDEHLIQGVQQPIITKSRFQIIELPSGSTIIDDAYNANPESMKAALTAFNSYQTNKNKIVVLGDMLSLGHDSAFWHRQIGRFLQKIHNLHQIVLIGSEVQQMKKVIPFKANCFFFDSIESAQEHVKNIVLQPQNVILFKASHSMRFEQLLEIVQNKK
ncbi:UDP-N-acetylmuramoyl-tripeptide--D-alanyl-D-alanine ligase [Candidatus Babeliales bacterium]|nr:UDP-N-acetylmuramoyl-tripeptide--D-alanyl-D-alanine ligase [Candidatus Babeliales bacterium]